MCVFFFLGWDSVCSGVWVSCGVKTWRYLLLHSPPWFCPLSGPVPPCLGNIGFVVAEFCIYSWRATLYFVKRCFWGSEEMVQQLRAPAALLEVLSFIPNTHDGFSTAWNSSFTGSDVLFRPLKTHVLMFTNSQPCIFVIKNKSFKNSPWKNLKGH